MFSHDITLNEFVYSIPICQLEADLGSILHIFHQTNCDSLAIPGENHTWGIVSSSDVLSLLAKSWQQLPISIVGYPKKTPHQYSSSIDTIRDFNSLVQPAMVYQADTYVEEFLRSLEDKYFNVSQSKYLIVNRAGELQGKLDQDKLLRYVASKYNGYSEKSTLPISSTSWLSLLDNLALPLKIETVEQKTCYENRCWQKLISHNRNEYLVKSQELNVSIANWWMEKQLDVRQQNFDEQNQVQADSTEKFCCLGDGYYSSYKPNTLSQPIDLISLNQKNIERQQSSIEYSNNCATPSLFGNLAEQPLENYTAGIRVEEGIEWNYIKIPMKLGNEQLSSTQATEYWLVLAIEPSLLCNDYQLKESAPTVKSTVDSLLASISHELKSPLTGIVGLSNLMSSQKLGDLNQRQTKYVQLIHNSGQKLMTIVNDLIELTSLTTGKFQLQPEEINLESLFHKLYQQVITKLNIDPTKSDLPILTAGLELNIPSGLETAIVDRLRLSSIISHLMRETIQFSDSPSIALKIEVKDSNKSRAITVKNETTNALAFPEEKLNIPSQSVGLNLIIAKYLAQAIQGDIQS